jgi:hypothetical protein
MGASDSVAAGSEERQVLTDALKRAKPARVVVTLSDGEKQSIAVPLTRRKWEHVCNVLENLEWSRALLLNKAGELIDTIDAEREEGPGAAAQKALPHEYALLDLILKGQTEALKHVVPAMTTLVQGLERITHNQLMRNDALERKLEKLMTVLERYRTTTGDDEDEDSENAMAAMVGAMMGVKPETVKAARAGFAGKPNGAHKEG